MKILLFNAEFNSVSNTIMFRMSANSAVNICEKYSNMLLTFPYIRNIRICPKEQEESDDNVGLLLYLCYTWYKSQHFSSWCNQGRARRGSTLSLDLSALPPELASSAKTFHKPYLQIFQHCSALPSPKSWLHRYISLYSNVSTHH